MSITLFSGCSNNENDTPTQLLQSNKITYSYKDVDATITSIDMRYWYATCPRWQWDISVEYNGIIFSDSGWANGVFNKPSFADCKVGDRVNVEIVTECINEKVSKSYIDKIN